MNSEIDFIKVDLILSVDIPSWTAGAKSFNTKLLDLISIADGKNLELLTKIYPEFVAAYMQWQAG